MFFPQKPIGIKAEPLLENEDDNGFAPTQPFTFEVEPNPLLQKRFDTSPQIPEIRPRNILRAAIGRPLHTIKPLVKDDSPEKGASEKIQKLHTNEKHILRNPLQRFASGASRLIKKTVKWVGTTLHDWREDSEERHRITTLSSDDARSREFAAYYETRGALHYEIKLSAIEKTTENLRAKTLEKLGPFNKKLLNFLEKGKSIFGQLEKGAEYLDKNVDKKIKLFASAGLITAGAFAGFAAPAVIAAIGATGIGMRIVSAASTYKLLNDAYKKWEEKHKDATAFKKLSLKTGTVFGAAFMGNIAGTAVQELGELFEKMSPPELYEKSIQAVKDVLPPSYEPLEGKGHLPAESLPPLNSVIAEDITKLNIPQQETITGAPEKTTIITPSQILEQIPTSEVVYEVKRGDSLWSALRKTLTGINFQDFSKLSSSAQEGVIRTLISKIEENPSAYGITSGNIHLIKSGEVLDFTKILN